MEIKTHIVGATTVVFLWLDSLLDYVRRGISFVASIVLWKISGPESRRHINASLYQNEKDYLPDSEFFNMGLFDWENLVSSHESFPKRGRLLIFAAGCGREAKSFLAKGYEVSALEPNQTFLRAGSSYFKANRNISWHAFSFETWLEAFEKKVLPEELMQKHTAIVIGWGALSYLYDAHLRTRFLKALKYLFPKAPILMSYLVHPKPQGTPARLKDMLFGKHSKNQSFLKRTGFTYLYETAEIQVLADETGYEVKMLEQMPYPYSFWTPFDNQNE
ncbi:MAG: hypothetical protein KDD48_06450 [Bdellovibrionales bacterium]|nr:hypothetical protein [Bdellovibrionales bacterium]